MNRDKVTIIFRLIYFDGLVAYIRWIFIDKETNIELLFMLFTSWIILS